MAILRFQHKKVYEAEGEGGVGFQVIYYSALVKSDTIMLKAFLARFNRAAN